MKVTISIEKTPGVCGGEARIGASRVTVWALEQLHRLGLDDAGILESYPEMTQDDLDAAWAYVEANRAEIESAIHENEKA
jgi:uncharacterized protein (DUF433 family)